MSTDDGKQIMAQYHAVVHARDARIAELIYALRDAEAELSRNELSSNYVLAKVREALAKAGPR